MLRSCGVLGRRGAGGARERVYQVVTEGTRAKKPDAEGETGERRGNRKEGEADERTSGERARARGVFRGRQREEESQWGWTAKMKRTQSRRRNRKKKSTTQPRGNKRGAGHKHGGAEWCGDSQGERRPGRRRRQEKQTAEAWGAGSKKEKGGHRKTKKSRRTV